MGIDAVGSEISSYGYCTVTQNKVNSSNSSDCLSTSEITANSEMDPLTYYKKLCSEYSDVTFRLDDMSEAFKNPDKLTLGYNGSMNQVGNNFGGKGNCSISIDIAVIKRMQSDPQYEQRIKGMIEDSKRRYSEFESDALKDGYQYVSVTIEDNNGQPQRGVAQSNYPYSTEDEVKCMWNSGEYYQRTVRLVEDIKSEAADIFFNMYDESRSKFESKAESIDAKMTDDYEVGSVEELSLLSSENTNSLHDKSVTENEISKLQEVQLTDNTTVGITQNGAVTECTSVKENENKEKVWTITAFTENGIVSNKCQNGMIIDSWEIKYSNPDDAKRVQELLNFFDKDANLIFSGSKNFWEDFLRNNMSANDVISAHGEVFDKAAPNAPAIVKEAWMEAAKETGYLEGGKMNHISQLLIRQVINRENGVEDYQNVFGSSVASAMQAAKELLYDLENPLTPISERGENAREYIEQEKEFYKKFIENLEEISNILVGDESNMHINKELAQKYSSQLKPVDDIAAVLKQPMQLAGHTQINKASNSIDIALGANVKVPGGFTLVVKEYGVEVQGVTNWNNQKESQDASDMAGALVTLLRNASGQLLHVGTDSRQITQWNEDVEKVLGYFGIDTSKDFTVNGVKYVRDGSGIHKATAA